MKSPGILLVLLMWWTTSLAQAKLQHKHFPVDDIMRVRVDFWKKVYTQINSEQGYLHDTDDLSVIYKTIDVSGMSGKRKSRFINAEKDLIKDQIKGLLGKKVSDLSESQKKLKALLGERSDGQLRAMASSIRFQQGMRDRYFEGLVRSYKYIERIRKIFREEGVPEELAYLPHVESSFNYQAYSKVGAAGIWQFMRGTARLYKLKIDYVIDERRDPIAATKAAAQFLKDNYERLQAWPLAVTAYNHGPASIDRAIRTHKTREISTIIQNYDGRRFGFASKNFYATFMAAVEISESPDEYFSFIPKTQPSEFSELRLERSMTIRQISKTLGIDVEVLKEYNLPLRPIAFTADVYLPEKYRLRIPVAGSDVIADYGQKIASASFKAPEKTESHVHVVARGESLYSIAKDYRINMMDLISLNGIQDPSRIQPGFRLQVPGKGESVGKVVAVANTPKMEAARPVASQTSPAPKQEIEIPPYLARDEPRPDETNEFIESLRKKYSSLDAQPTKEVPETPAEAAEAPPVSRAVNSIDIAAYDFQMKKFGENVYELYVEPEETIGHYADWANVPTRLIRQLNNMRFGANIQVGQRLRIPVGERKIEHFKTKRIEHHLAIEEDFYTNFRITGYEEYTIKSGDTLEGLIRKYEIPSWLLKRAQTNGDSIQLVAGNKIRIPTVEATTEPATDTATETAGP